MLRPPDYIDLPEPGHAGLVHPVQLPAARRDYAVAGVLAAAASPSVLLASVLVLLVVSDNILTPFVGPAVGLTATAYAERRFRADAWAHIARRHQDVDRDDPWGRSVLAALVCLGVLAAGLLSFASDVDASAAPTAAASVGVGAIMGVAFVMLTATVWDWAARPQLRLSRAPIALATSTRILSLSVLAVAGIRVMGLQPVDPVVAGLGGLSSIAVIALWTVFRLMPAKIACLPPGAALP